LNTRQPTISAARRPHSVGFLHTLGQSVLSGGFSLASLAEHAFANEINPQAVSGRQELLEGVVNRFIYT
ncbi:xylose isomerase, partial [Pseudomonas syringae pv. actinidiae]|nr:xylose isomerase [Pseudomonas syringae pv. actinidiae]